MNYQSSKYETLACLECSLRQCCLPPSSYKQVQCFSPSIAARFLDCLLERTAPLIGGRGGLVPAGDVVRAERRERRDENAAPVLPYSGKKNGLGS